MQSSPLQLEDYDLKELRFAIVLPLNEPVNPGMQFDPIDIEIGAQTEKRDNDPYRWRCEVTVRTNEAAEGNFAYSFSLTYVGFFRVVKDFPAERIEQMVRTNAPAILYSAAREAIVYLSGRGRQPAVLLPSITFIEPPRQAASQPNKPTKKRGGRKKPKAKPLSK